MISVNRRSCVPCARSKRKCGKELPECRRCVSRSVACEYQGGPWSDRSRHTFSIGCGNPGPAAHVYTPETSESSNSPSLLPDHEVSSGTDAETLPCQTIFPSLEDLQSAWFLRLETWHVMSFSSEIPNRPLNSTMLEEFVNIIYGWLEDWVSRGSNVFVHRSLYGSRLASPISNAFTTLSSFIHRTAETEQLVFRIVEARMSELVDLEQPSNLLDHLSRVQALIAYAIIGLFKGNIRLRHVAERHLHLLGSWAEQMRQAAADAARSGQLLLDAALSALDSRNTDVDVGDLGQHRRDQCLGHIWRQFGEAEQEATLWHAWIVAESVRRTWTVARGVESVYQLLRDGTGPCPGGLMFTTRRGVWDASSAFAWTKICAEAKAGFLHLRETDKLFAPTSGESLDELATFLVQMNFRTERVRHWLEGRSLPA